MGGGVSSSQREVSGERSLSTVQEEDAIFPSFAHPDPSLHKHAYWGSRKALSFLLSLAICIMALPISHRPIDL